MARMNDNGLSDKQEAFCQEYIKDFNGSAAAIRAGYKARSAKEQASMLLTKVNVASRIKELTSNTAKNNESLMALIKAELVKIAFANKKSVAKWNASGVTFRDSEELTDEEAASVSEVSETVTESGGTLKIKQHDKVKALELLAKMEGAFAPQKIEHSGTLSLEQLVSGSHKVEDEES